MPKTTTKRKSKPKRKEPVWQGPEKDGITQSLLSRFLVCRERFRLLVVEGLKPVDQFNHRVEYGNMWHVCEEEYAKRGGSTGWCDIIKRLKTYCQMLCKKYPLQQEQVQHWYNVCKTQFPIYVDYWAKHSSKEKRTHLLQEQTFDVPYKLPSGRLVRLRGKWDGIDLVGKGRNAGVYLQEHKTKGDINEQQMKTQLQFDLQTMFYLVALAADMNSGKMIEANYLLAGIDYNVVRRPLSGGKGSIRRHQATSRKPEETPEHFYARLGDIIKEDPEYYFMRWKVEITPEDLERFKREFLDPILDQLCDWWEWVVDWVPKPFKRNVETVNRLHWRHPYGVYNVLNEGGSSELDEHLATGSTLGLRRADNLFKELE